MKEILLLVTIVFFLSMLIIDQHYPNEVSFDTPQPCVTFWGAGKAAAILSRGVASGESHGTAKGCHYNLQLES